MLGHPSEMQVLIWPSQFNLWHPPPKYTQPFSFKQILLKLLFIFLISPPFSYRLYDLSKVCNTDFWWFGVCPLSRPWCTMVSSHTMSVEAYRHLLRGNIRHPRYTGSFWKGTSHNRPYVKRPVNWSSLDKRPWPWLHTRAPPSPRPIVTMQTHPVLYSLLQVRAKGCVLVSWVRVEGDGACGRCCGLARGSTGMWAARPLPKETIT